MSPLSSYPTLLISLPYFCTIIFSKYIARGPVSDLCFAPLDVVHVNEATSLFDPLWPILATQATKILDYMSSINPQSRFGFGSYADKPTAPLGYPEDWCFRQELSLQTREAAEVADLYTHYASTLQGGGGDWPQNSLGAIFRALFSPAMGWQDLKDGRFMASSPRSGNHTRVLLLVVGSTPHEAGDFEALTGEKVGEFDLTSDDLLSDANAKCDSVDYPELAKIGDYLAARNIVTVVLARPGGTMHPDGSFSPAKSLALKGKQYRTPEGLAMWYKDVLTARGVKVFSNLLEDRMSAFFPTFEAAMDRFMEWRCEPTVETTEVPPEETVSEVEGGETVSESGNGSENCACPCPSGCCCPAKVSVKVEVVKGKRNVEGEVTESVDSFSDPTMEAEGERRRK